MKLCLPLEIPSIPALPATGGTCGAIHVFAPLPTVAVPALGPVGMVVLGILLAGAGMVLLRRRAVL